jgi:hypothetical protein
MRLVLALAVGLVACDGGDDPKTSGVDDTDVSDTDPGTDTDPGPDTDVEDTDPVDTDPVDTDPVDTDPVDTDPVDTDTDPPVVDLDLDGSPAGVDCDDAEPSVYPGAPERCDGLDNDCAPATPDAGAWFVPAAGAGVDVTSSVQGTLSAPGSYTVAAGTLRLCAGTWWSRLTVQQGGRVEGTDVTVNGGAGRPLTFASGATGMSAENLTLLGEATEGGGVYVGGGSEVTLLAVAVESSSADRGGGMYIGATADVTAAMSFTECDADEGGAVWVGSQATLEFTAAELEGNRATEGGGGLHLDSGANLVATDAVFVNNGAGFGGAVELAEAGYFGCTGCMFMSNFGQQGGAIFAQSSGPIVLDGEAGGGWVFQHADLGDGGFLWARDVTQVSITDVYIGTTYASGYGGALHLVEVADVTLTDVTLDDNEALGDGGAMVAVDSAVTLTRVAVVDNVAGSDAAGLQLHQSDLTMVGGSLAENLSGEQGGGARIQGGTVTFEDVDIQENLAAAGGGLWMSDATVTLDGGTLWSNEAAASHGGGVFLNTGTLSVVACNLGTGATENEPHDVAAGGMTYDWPGATTVTCTGSGCP